MVKKHSGVHIFKEGGKSTSEWQKRNKEYLEKKVREEASKQRGWKEKRKKLLGTNQLWEIAEDGRWPSAKRLNRRWRSDQSEPSWDWMPSEKERKKLEKLQKKARKKLLRVYLRGSASLSSDCRFCWAVAWFSPVSLFLTPLLTMKTIASFRELKWSVREDLLKSSKIDEKDYISPSLPLAQSSARRSF